MANKQKICVFDLETDGVDPEKCDPVQIAALMIDPVSLEIIPDSEFNINCKPAKLEKDKDYCYEDSDVLEFHAKVTGSSKDKVLASWREYPKQSASWKMFISYLDKYHTRSSRKNQFSAPIAAGYNINRFDLRILQRLSTKYKNVNKEGNMNIFYPRDVVDIMNILFYWFESNNELEKYTLDHFRDYVGISKEGAHDALKDVQDSAQILIRFLKLHRTLSEKIKFRNSFT